MHAPRPGSKSNAPRITRVDSSGPALLFGHIGQRNIRAMLLGTTVALLGISIILIGALRSLRLGIVSLVPNFVPCRHGVWYLGARLIGQVGTRAVGGRGHDDRNRGG